MKNWPIRYIRLQMPSPWSAEAFLCETDHSIDGIIYKHYDYHEDIKFRLLKTEVKEINEIRYFSDHYVEDTTVIPIYRLIRSGYNPWTFETHGIFKVCDYFLYNPKET